MHYDLFFILFFISVLIQSAYYLFFLRPVVRQPPVKGNRNQLQISIIICAKNESQNLKTFLPLVLLQDYPKNNWEVIVVNDASTDDSEKILRHFQALYGHLKVITIPVSEPRDLPGKKFALETAIRQAEFDTLLLTDADCKPATDQWLRLFSEHKANTGKQILLGYGRYEKAHTLLNRFVQWETLHTAMQYFSFSASKMTYMGVGRNIMYEKQLYFQAKNDAQFWETYQLLPSGDDDLLVSKISNKSNTGIVLNEAAQTISNSPKTWDEWRKQKARHVSTGKFYPFKIKCLLGIFAVSHTLFWFSGFCLTFFYFSTNDDKWLLMTILLFFLRTLLSLLNALKWKKRLSEKKILLFYMPGDIAWSIYNVFLSPYIFWKNKQAWK